MSKTYYDCQYYEKKSGMYLGFDKGKTLDELLFKVKGKKKVGGRPIEAVRCVIVKGTYKYNEDISKSGYVEEIIQEI